MSKIVEPSAEQLREFYFRVRELKRQIAWKSPAINFDKVLLVDMPYPQGSEWQHETRHRLGYMAVPGARLLTLESLRPDGKLTQLMPQAPLHGSFWRPNVSFDANRIVFCFKPGWALSTRDTSARSTPARRATSRMVGRFAGTGIAVGTSGLARTAAPLLPAA